MENKQERNAEVYYGSAYRNDTIKKENGELVHLTIPYYTMTLRKDMIKDLKPTEDGMLHFSIHARKEQEQGKPNCNVIGNKFFSSEGKFIDLYSIKDLNIRKDDLMNMPTNSYGDLCLVVNTRGEILTNNKVLGIDADAQKLQGAAFEVNPVQRQKRLEMQNGKEVDNSLKFIGSAYQIQSLPVDGKPHKPFFTLTLDRDSIKDIPADNNGFVHISIRERKVQEEGKPTHSIVASPHFYNNNNQDDKVVREIMVNKNHLLNNDLVIAKDVNTKQGEVRRVETVSLTLSSLNILKVDKYRYPHLVDKDIPMQAVASENTRASKKEEITNKPTQTEQPQKQERKRKVTHKF